MNEEKEIIVADEVEVIETSEPYVYDLPEEKHKTNKVAVGIGVSLLTAALTGGLLLWRKHKKKKAEEEACDDFDEEEYEDDEENENCEDNEDSEEENKSKTKK